MHRHCQTLRKPQDELAIEGEGVKIPKIAAMAKALDAWIPLKDKRVAASVGEKAAKAVLLDVFHKHADKMPKGEDGALLYRHDGKIYRLIPGREKLKIEDDEEEDDQD